MSEQQIHQGRNIKRFREMLNLSQEGLAYELGGDWTQRRISLLEQKETVDDPILEEVSKILKVSPEVLKKFNEEKAYNIIGNIVTTVNDSATGQIFQFNPNFNPIEKLVELVDENKKVVEENKQLYQQLLKEKDEKIALLEKLAKK